MRPRRLAELDGAAAAWFAPALERRRALAADPDARVHRYFGRRDPIFVGRAPGRLDVMGGIADYSGALVLELPLDRATFAIVQRQDVARCDVATRREGGWRCFAIDLQRLIGAASDAAALGQWFAGRDDQWAAYVVGVVQLCLRRAATARVAPPRGFRILIDSTVPEGKGVSSSAALEVATMAAVSAALELPVAAAEMARACQWVENHVVRAPCGIMDQMTSACGRRGRLLRLRCQPDVVEGYLDLPAGVRFYGIDSGVRHAVTGDAYGRVRTAAFMGYRIIAERAGLPVAAGDAHRVRIDDPRWNGYLANIPVAEFRSCFEQHLPPRITGAEFLAAYGGITDTVTRVEPDAWYPVRQATAHPVYEQERVSRFARLLAELPRPQGAHELGALMHASHASYGACGLGRAETDRLVALVAEAGAARGLFGAKITGGGSGGTVAILGTTSAEATVREIAARYADEIGETVDVFVDSGPGAEETGVLRLDPDD